MTYIEKVNEKSIIQYAEEHDLKGMTVLVRIDVNVTLTPEGKVDGGEDWRITQAYQTLDFLVERKARLIVLSHIGRDPEETLRPIFEVMKKRLPTMKFVATYEQTIIDDAVTHMNDGDIVMFENVRMHAGETENDPGYLLPIVKHCQVYINDAFSVSHRPHASVHVVTKLLPSYFGLQMQDEVTNLTQALDAPGIRTLVLGGAKFGTKLDLLEKLLPQVSYVLMGGALANVFLKDRGFQIGTSFVDENANISTMVHSEKIILPIDVVDQHGDVFPIDEMTTDDTILDIGHETEALFGQIISGSNVVIWNGPMGKYEDGYTSGSLSIAESIAQSNTFSVTGGGDTAAVILQGNAMDGFSFVSTGGGAMLDFLVAGSLPCVDVILDHE